MLMLLVCMFEFVGVFSCVLSEMERCNIIHERVERQKRGYRNFHELEHCKESLLTVVCYYLLNKLLLLVGRDWTACTLLPVVLLLPLYFTFVLDRRYSIFIVGDNAKLIGTKTTPTAAYAVFVAAVMLCCDYSAAMLLVVAQPLIKHALGNLLSMMIHVTACYSVVLDESIGWSVVQLASLILLTKSLEHISSLRLYPKM